MGKAKSQTSSNIAPVIVVYLKDGNKKKKGELIITHRRAWVWLIIYGVEKAYHLYLSNHILRKHSLKRGGHYAVRKFGIVPSLPLFSIGFWIPSF